MIDNAIYFRARTRTDLLDELSNIEVIFNEVLEAPKINVESFLQTESRDGRINKITPERSETDEREHVTMLDVALRTDGKTEIADGHDDRVKFMKTSQGISVGVMIQEDSPAYDALKDMLAGEPYKHVDLWGDDTPDTIVRGNLTDSVIHVILGIKGQPLYTPSKN